MTIKPNVTMDLKTCDPWGLTITGGTPPYNVTILSVGATFVTNVTVPKGFDALTYINRANPNGAILGMFYARHLNNAHSLTSFGSQLQSVIRK
jgi:hypothetical protein